MTGRPNYLRRRWVQRIAAVMLALAVLGGPSAAAVAAVPVEASRAIQGRYEALGAGPECWAPRRRR